MKAVVDRIVQYANRYQLTDVSTGQVLGTFDFDEVTGTVQQVGTEIDAELFQTIADDLAARVKLSGGELKDTVVTFSDISGTAANVASGDTSATLWGKVKNWFSRLKALAFKDTISNSDVASNAAIAQSKVNGLESALATKANDADLATIAKTGNLSDATEDATHRTVTDTEKAAWNAKQDALTFDDAPTAGSANPVKSGGVKTALDAKANNADLATIAKSGKLSDATEDATHRVVTDTEKATWNAKQDALTFDTTPTEGSTNPVTSGGIKAVLDEKQETVTGGASTIVSSDLTESRALVSDASGKVAVSDVTATEFGYLDGVNSNIQEQLDNISGGTGFVSTSPQTLTSKQQAQARSNIGAQASGNYALQDGTYPNLNTPKTLYNLGAYDTYTSNGDGTATITRKTGYVVINAEDCTSRDQSSVSGNYCCYTSIKPQNVGGVFGATIGVASNGYTVQNNNINFTPNLGIGLMNENSLVIRNDSFTDVSEYRAICPIYVQFELATSYTEQVIENQPLNTLPQDGEQWVRDEWEKGLNLCSINEEITINPGSEQWKNYYFSDTNNYHNLEEGKTYTATVFNIPDGIIAQLVYLVDGSFVHIEISNGQKETIVYTSDINAHIRIGNNTVANQTTLTPLIVVNEGSHPYPYQPYNGEIIHKKQLNEALEEYISFAGVVTDLDNVSIGEYQKPFYGFVNSNTPNAPDTSSGTLFANNHTAEYASQQYITDTGSFYFRNKQSGIWQAWKQIATRSDLSSYLPLTGGTVGGNLNVTENLRENGNRVYSPNNPPHASELRGTFSSGYTLTDNTRAMFVTIWGEESSERGLLWISTPDGYIAEASGDDGYWGKSYLCVSAFIPAGVTATLRKTNMNTTYYHVMYLD